MRNETINITEQRSVLEEMEIEEVEEVVAPGHLFGG